MFPRCTLYTVYNEGWGADQSKTPRTDLLCHLIRRMTSSMPRATSPSLRNPVCTSSILIFKNKYLAFSSTKSPLFEKSQPRGSVCGAPGFSAPLPLYNLREILFLISTFFSSLSFQNTISLYQIPLWRKGIQ